MPPDPPSQRPMRPVQRTPFEEEILPVLAALADPILARKPPLAAAPGAAAAPLCAPDSPIASDDPEKLAAMKALLAKSATGRAAVAYRESKNIPVVFRPGCGSYWDNGRIVIDSNKSTGTAALTLVHEVNHARSTLEGAVPDIMRETRADYVRKRIEEEALGNVQAIRAKNELAAAGVNVAGMEVPFETEYNASYARIALPLVSDPLAEPGRDWKAAVEAAGMQEVVDAIARGDGRTSTTNQTYGDFYGEEWDQRHARP